MAAMNSDPRYVRVRSRLTEAALRLVLQKPADTITVSRLAREAGISRTTFYQHGDTPAQFVADVVVDIMQPYLDELVRAIAPPPLTIWCAGGKLACVCWCAQAEQRRRSANFLGGSPVGEVLGHISVRLTQTFEAYVGSLTRLAGEEMSKL